MPYKDKEEGKARRREWWANLPDDKKREKLDKAKDRARTIKDFISTYKLDRGCRDCGYKQHAAALDFDHISDDKLLNVCNAKSIAQAEKEIAKCEVVCSNCHRIRTYNRLKEQYNTLN